MTGSTMDFFGHQDAARRATSRLVFLFALAVLAIIVTIYLVAAAIFSVTDMRGEAWHPGMFFAVAVGVIAVVSFAAMIKTSQLRAGGPAVAEMLGGTPVEPGSRDPKLAQLHNVVEEMAIASGIPVPRVYVLEEESGINAFAAGWGTSDAAVAVTRGALLAFDRDELQGVIAHEFSHVFHGDMRLNIRLMGVLFGIVCIASVGEILMRTMGRVRDKKGNGAALAIFGLALMVIGWIGVFFANLIKAAVSRQREFLADASAVAYTRNPRGIGLALAKIAGHGSRLRNANARQASHLFFADGVARWFGSLGATHPPIEQRIERVLPGFAAELKRTQSPEQAAAKLAPQLAAAAAPAGTSSFATPSRVRAAEITGHVGTTTTAATERVRAQFAALPLDLVSAARSPAQAPALLYALLLQQGDAAQQTILAQCDAARAHEARVLAAHLRGIDRTLRLPLLEAAIPALRSQPPADRVALHAELDALARADGALSPFEFALLHTVRRHVPTPQQRSPSPTRAVPLTSAATEIGTVLSAIAHASGGAATAAFARGVAAMPGLPLQLSPPSAGFTALEKATSRLEQLSPLAKKQLLTACAEVAAADGEIAADEGELLRAFAESWNCPLPPLWSGGGPSS